MMPVWGNAVSGAGVGPEGGGSPSPPPTSNATRAGKTEVAEPSLASVWARVLGDLEQRLSAEKVQRWFGSTSLLADDGRAATIGVPNLFIQEWIQQRYAETLKEAFKNCVGERRLKLRIDGELYREFRAAEAKFLEEQGTDGAEQHGSESSHARSADHVGQRPAAPKSPLNENFTLQRFVVAACNHVAFNAGLEVIERPGQAYNPLVVFGGCGLGKTHLLQAIAREYFRQGRRRIRYLSCESFTNQFVQSVRKGTLDGFRQKFHSLEALVLDDVQLLENKAKTQLELLHLIDILHSRGGQVICASDIRPRAIPGLHEQLQGRFVSGLLCKIEPPDFNARLSILRGEAARVAVEVPESGLRLIADSFGGNVRELIGAFVRVTAFASLIDERLTEERVRSILDEQVWSQRRGVTVDAIVELVASQRGHTPDTLRSRSRIRSVSEARQLAIYLARVLTDHSLAELGTHFGGRNHATVNFAYRRVLERLQEDPALAREVERWLAELQS